MSDVTTNGGPTTTLSGGATMPLVGLGTWRLRDESARTAVAHALEVGYRHVDTATGYGNEVEVGEGLRDSGVARDDVFVTTKLPAENAGRERTTIENSLRALRLDYVDLWLVHWPPGGQAAPQTWEQMLAARDDGLARAVGVSNYNTAQVDELIAATGQAPAVNQVPWGPSLFDPELLAQHRERDVVLEGYSPFRSTDLGAEALASVAAAHGVTPEQVVLRWHLEHGVVVIPKSAQPERIERNFDVFGFDLDPNEVRQIDALASTA